MQNQIRTENSTFTYLQKRDDVPAIEEAILDAMWNSPDAMRDALRTVTPVFVHGPCGGHWTYRMETPLGQITMDQALYLTYQDRYCGEMLGKTADFLIQSLEDNV